MCIIDFRKLERSTCPGLWPSICSTALWSRWSAFSRFDSGSSFAALSLQWAKNLWEWTRGHQGWPLRQAYQAYGQQRLASSSQGFTWRCSHLLHIFTMTSMMSSKPGKWKLPKVGLQNQFKMKRPEMIAFEMTVSFLHFDDFWVENVEKSLLRQLHLHMEHRSKNSFGLRTDVGPIILWS